MRATELIRKGSIARCSAAGRSEAGRLFAFFFFLSFFPGVFINLG